MTHPKKVTLSITRAKYERGPRWRSVIYGYNEAGRCTLTEYMPGSQEGADAALLRAESHARRKWPAAPIGIAEAARKFVTQEDLGAIQKDAPPITVVVSLRTIPQKTGPDRYVALVRRYTGRRSLVGEVVVTLTHEDPRAALQAGLASARAQFASEPIVTSPVAERMIEIWQLAQVGAPA